MKMKIEVVIVRVSDVDRGKAFYEKAGSAVALSRHNPAKLAVPAGGPNFLPAVAAMVVLWFRFLPPPCSLPLLSHCRQ